MQREAGREDIEKIPGSAAGRRAGSPRLGQELFFGRRAQLFLRPQQLFILILAEQRILLRAVELCCTEPFAELVGRPVVFIFIGEVGGLIFVERQRLRLGKSQLFERFIFVEFPAGQAERCGQRQSQAF